MRKYKGDIEDFPKEIVEKILYYQKKQGNKRDVSVFEKCRQSDRPGGGFTWGYTPEKYIFWHQIIVQKHFTLFFEKYPKKETNILITNKKQENGPIKVRSTIALVTKGERRGGRVIRS